jgi:hypothetical protein
VIASEVEQDGRLPRLRLKSARAALRLAAATTLA